ncbi:MAG: hypothetical protein RL254_332, partial [Planctomycetota bacterium]
GRAEPHTSTLVLHDAHDHVLARDTDIQIRFNRRQRERSERRSVESTHAAERADPEQSIAVDDDAPDVVVRKTVFGCVRGEPGAVILDQSVVRAEPHGVVLVLNDGTHRFAWETFLIAEEIHCFAVVAGDAIAVGPKPETAAAVFKDASNERTERRDGRGL